MKTWFLGGIGIVFVLLIGLGVGLFIAGALGSNGSPGETVADGEAVVEETRRAPIYYDIEPAFVVNVQAERRIRYLQVKVELMARDQDSIDAVERHIPRIRNSLLMLFGDIDYEKVQARAGREALQEEARKQIIEVLEAEDEPAEIESVFFTNFVMQ